MTDSAIHWLFSAGHSADIVLGVLAAEALWLRTRCWDWAPILGLLGPAALIVLGLRAAMIGAEWYWTALPLALSFPVHIMDIKLRERAAAQGNAGED